MKMKKCHLMRFFSTQTKQSLLNFTLSVNESDVDEIQKICFQIDLKWLNNATERILPCLWALVSYFLRNRRASESGMT